jgi:hypothetical protein
MKKTEARRKLKEIEYEYEVENRASNINRARSITVGKTIDGLTEIMMRSDGGRHIWHCMGAEAVADLVYQLASNVGCIIELETRKTLRLKNSTHKTEDYKVKEDQESNDQSVNKARSISIGTAFGGTSEIMLRADGGRHIWCVMQPVEVVELIHQLAANIGYNLKIKPRNDFSSWRDWRITAEDRLHYGNHAPFVNDMAPFHQLGANMQKIDDVKLLEKINSVILQHHSAPNPELQQESVPNTLLTDNTKEQKDNIIDFSTFVDGAPNLTIDPELGVLNKIVVNPDGSETLYGGAGGGTEERIKQFKKKPKNL